MAKVITLTGMSASGKDAILKGVISRSSIKPVISTTSRPIRNGETDGVEYNFVSKEQAERMLYGGKFIEVREYYVANGDRWLYGITKGSIDINSDNTYIVIVDYEGLKQLNRYLDKNNVKHYSYYLNVNYQEAQDYCRSGRSFLSSCPEHDEDLCHPVSRSCAYDTR